MSNFVTIGNGLTFLSLAADPGSPVAGMLYYNNVSNVLRYYNGTSWIDINATTPGNYVTLDSAQTITAKKTFGVAPDLKGVTLTGSATNSDTDIPELAFSDVSKITLTGTSAVLRGFDSTVLTGSLVIIENASGGDITITDNDGTAPERKIITGSGADITVPNLGHILMYVDTTDVYIMGAGGGGGGGADQQLSNLSATAVNTDILPDADSTHDLGSSSLRWSEIFSDVLNGQSLELTTSYDTDVSVIEDIDPGDVYLINYDAPVFGRFTGLSNAVPVGKFFKLVNSSPTSQCVIYHLNAVSGRNTFVLGGRNVYLAPGESADLYVDPISNLVLCTSTVARYDSAGAGKVGLVNAGTGVYDALDQLNAIANSTPINYITYGLASANAVDSAHANWPAYADAAGPVPVDGTGGSANVSFSSNGTGILRNNLNWQLAKTAVNRQGEGIAYPFTIDRADRAKVLRISFDYEPTDSNFAYNAGTPASPSDIAVYVYDITNSVLIYPSNSFLNGSGKFTSEFQTSSNSTSYRLIFHIATTNALAWTLNFTNVQVGPSPVASGAVVTDWTSYTPTIAGFGSPAAVNFKYRRVGDTIEVTGRFQSGTPAVAAATISLPAGLAADVSKVPNTANWLVGDAGSGLADAVVNRFALIYATTTTVTFSRRTSSASDLTAVTADGVAASGHQLSVRFSLPIAGWSSNVVVSSDYGSRVIAAKAIGTATGPTNASAPIVFPTEVFDTTGSYNPATGVFTAPETGIYKYDVSINVTSSDTNVAAYAIIQPFVNGSGSGQTRYLRRKYINSSSDTVRANGTVRLNAGDTLEFRFEGNYSSPTLGAEGTELNIFKIQSPQTLAGGEVIAFSGTNTAGTAIGTGLGDVPFAITRDTHGSFVSPNYTVSQSGWYTVSCVLTTVAVNLSTAQNFTGAIFLDGVTVAQGRVNGVGASTNHVVSFTQTVYCTQGQILKVRAVSSVATTLFTGAGNNFFSIVKQN